MKYTTTIMGIDPGINHCGWSIGKYDQNAKITTIVAFGTIEANNLAKTNHKDEFKKFTNIISLQVYREEIEKLLVKYEPDYIVSEDAFYNPKMPNAYMSLKLCIFTIAKLLYEHNNKLLYTIAPKLAKQIIFGSGNANKVAVQEGIRNHSDLILKNTKSYPLDKMVEHEADSIAILYSFVKTTLEDLLLTENKKKR